MGSHANAVVVDNVVRHDVWFLSVTSCVSKDDVCITTLESLQGSAPLFHHEFDGHANLLHHGTHHIDIAACGLTIVIEELIGRLVPVAHHHHRSLRRILVVQRLSGNSE